MEEVNNVFARPSLSIMLFWLDSFFFQTALHEYSVLVQLVGCRVNLKLIYLYLVKLERTIKQNIFT